MPTTDFFEDNKAIDELLAKKITKQLAGKISTSFNPAKITIEKARGDISRVNYLIPGTHTDIPVDFGFIIKEKSSFKILFMPGLAKRKHKNNIEAAYQLIITKIRFLFGGNQASTGNPPIEPGQTEPVKIDRTPFIKYLKQRKSELEKAFGNEDSQEHILFENAARINQLDEILEHLNQVELLP